MVLGSFELTLIHDGLFYMPPNAFDKTDPREHSHLLIGMNCLLVRGHGQTILIDTGVGTKPRRNFVEFYRMEWPRRLYAELEELGIQHQDIDTVILTHLHWDHAGGATCIGDLGVDIAFPRARYFVQRKEWEAAIKAPPDDDGYLLEDFTVLDEAGVLTLLDGGGEILPGIEVRLTGGHSSGHQIVLVGDSDSERAVFLADLIPTASMLSPEVAMTYDFDKETLAREKRKILREAVTNHWLLIFQHAPKLCAGYLSSEQMSSPKINWVAL